MHSLQKSKKLRLQRGHRGQAKWSSWQNKYEVVQMVSSIKQFCSLCPSSSTWSVRFLLILPCFPLIFMPILSTLLISTTQWLIPASQPLLTAFLSILYMSNSSLFEGILPRAGFLPSSISNGLYLVTGTVFDNGEMSNRWNLLSHSVVAGEISQWGKCISGKHETLSADPRTHEKLDSVTHVPEPSIPTVGWKCIDPQGPNI